MTLDPYWGQDQESNMRQRIANWESSCATSAGAASMLLFAILCYCLFLVVINCYGRGRWKFTLGRAMVEREGDARCGREK